MQITPMDGSLGAEVRGVDLSVAMDMSTLTALKAAWCKHLVLVFRNQKLSTEQHLAFARCFGELEIYPLGDNRDTDNPEIFRVSNCDKFGVLLDSHHPDSLWNNLTEYWHTDSSYRAVPAYGAVLYAIEVPERGGDTLFVNLEAAFEALAPSRKSELERLTATHDWMHGYSYAGHLMKPMKVEETKPIPPVEHPLVRRNTLTDKSALFISPGYVSAVDGLSDQATKKLLADLLEWATKPEFLYRHVWQAGDVLLWNNPSTMHAREAFDYGTDRRIMHRATIMGR